jgi:DNA-binding SARP family transcriptional activator
VDISIHFLSGAVRRDGRAVALSEILRNALFAIARSRRPSSGEELMDALWPEADKNAARDRLYVTLHRLRNGLKCQAVTRARGGFALADGITVDLWELEDALCRDGAAGATRDGRLRALFDRLPRLSEVTPLRGEWSVPTVRRVASLREELCLRLAHGELEAGRAADALHVARCMLDYDPCDESAHEVALLAYRALRRPGAAMHERRSHADDLRVALA